MSDPDVETVRRSLAQYDAWGIREGWTMMSQHNAALDRILAQRADLLAALEELVEHYEPMGRMGDYARAAIAAAHQGESPEAQRLRGADEARRRVAWEDEQKYRAHQGEET